MTDAAMKIVDLNHPTTVVEEPVGALENTTFLLTIIRSQWSGQGCLPEQLGLNVGDYAQLMDRVSIHRWEYQHIPAAIKEKSATRQELLELRRGEWQDLVELLIAHASGKDSAERWMAQIIAAACMGSGHLWRDLGLSDRQSLKRLFTLNFPSLSAKNNADMRWKKFLYRQLCEQGGHFVCRSPSCETCPTYNECFGDET